MTALHKQGVKVLLGVGGWNEGSANYSKMASSPDSRKAFVASTVKFLKYGFYNINFACLFFVLQLFYNSSSIFFFKKFIMRGIIYLSLPKY